MQKDLVTAHAVTHAILQRITTGQLSVGDRLPPVRKLAEELGSNRNTVNKAYQMLFDLGVVNNDNRRTGYTVKRNTHSNTQSRPELIAYFRKQAVDLAWQEMAAGLQADEMFGLWEEAVGEVLGQTTVRPIFFECNDHDTIEMGRRLVEVLGMPVEYRNLPDFYADPQGVLERHDLIITTYHHLAEINQAVQRLGRASERVIGIETRLTPDSMLHIARLPKTHLGVVCTNVNTAHMIKHLLTSYRGEWVIDAVSTDDAEQVKAVGRTCDHLIVTHTCAVEAQALTGRAPDVIVNFQIDEQSVAFLHQRIDEIRQERMRRLRERPQTLPIAH